MEEGKKRGWPHLRNFVTPIHHHRDSHKRVQRPEEAIPAWLLRKEKHPVRARRGRGGKEK